MVLQIPPEKITEFSAKLHNASAWKPLPLPEEFAQNEHYLQPNRLFGVKGTIPITTAKGYYLFQDSQIGRYDTTKPFYERSSFNFTFALFDERDGKVYIWVLST